MRTYKKATAKANTNIALIKYWGKRDGKRMLPTNSSLSITLDRYYTITTVEFSEELLEDTILLNNNPVSMIEQKNNNSRVFGRTVRGYDPIEQ